MAVERYVVEEEEEELEEEREKEVETDRETDKQTDTDRQIDIQTNRQTYRRTNRQSPSSGIVVARRSDSVIGACVTTTHEHERTGERNS